MGNAIELTGRIVFSVEAIFIVYKNFEAAFCKASFPARKLTENLWNKRIKRRNAIEWFRGKDTYKAKERQE